MNKKPNVYAFIDSQNLNLGIRDLGWKVDHERFRVYLADKYNVTKAYIFIGFLPENAQLYASLQSAGFICIFRPTLVYRDGTTKGNCDAELVLQAMIDISKYDKAVLVSGDGDFQCLAKYLHEQDKLEALLIPNQHKFSALLKFDFLKPYHRFVSDLRKKLEYSPKKKNPRKDKTLKGNSSIGDKNIVAKGSGSVNKKQKDQRRRSVETLGVSGHGDSPTVAKKPVHIKRKGNRKFA
jgi:uncharacterized LabA/DUF88 family protein